MARILVTGAHGFIGKHLARHLAAQGHEVSGLGHGIWPPQEAAQWGIRDWLNGDVHAGNLRALQARGQIDVVFHLAGGSTVGAAIANPREDFFRTVTSTVELLEWMRLDAAHVRLIAVSSAAVYGALYTTPIPESAPHAPYSPYGHHKHMMEMQCRSYADTYGLTCQVARLFSVYGPELKKQLLWDLCTRLAGGRLPLVLGGTGNEVRDWTYVADVVRALEVIAFHPDQDAVGDTVNVGTGTGTLVKDIARRFIDAWQPAPRSVSGPVVSFSGESRAGDPFSLVADPTRLNSLGFSWNTTLHDGVALFVDWFRRAFSV